MKRQIFGTLILMLLSLQPLLCDEKAFLHQLQQDKECPHCQHPPLVAESEADILVFISFSVPLESWKDLSAQLEKAGGKFVLRGAPGDSFELLGVKILELRAAGVNAPIDIDPELFSRYKIDTVPATLVVQGKKSDLVRGNLRLDVALRLIADSGDAQQNALKLLQKIEERP